MGKIAFIFPGQGAQSVGMGADAYEENSAAKAVYDRFNEVLGRNLTTVCFEGPEEDLKQTTNTQPAILATSIALLEALKEKTGITPDYTCGHSLGEYGALYTAGVLSLDDTIKAIGKRAELMGQASGGAMAAVLASQELVEKAVADAQNTGQVSVANFNTPEQIVITGSDEGVLKASELATEAGAKRVVPLPVSGAFHSPMMRPAADEFAGFVQELAINDAKIPVITNVDAKETTSSDDFKTKMPEQIYSSVYWTQTVQYLASQGVDTVIEIGPGKVLMGLNRKITRDIKTLNVYDLASLDKVVESLQEV